MWISISDKYEASDAGQIRNKKTGRVLRQFVGKDGYMRTQFDGKTRTVHRVIATGFVPAESGKDFVNHKDGNKLNNSAQNLEWCTRSENIKHAFSHGLKTTAGERNPRAKLNSGDVEYIKENYRRGDKEYGANSLAKKFGVARQTICAAVSGQNWCGGAE